MKKHLKVIALTLALLLGTSSLCFAAENYTYDYLQTLPGGFTQTIETYANEEGLTVAQFRALCEKAAVDMTPDELAKMNRIREKQLKPDENTLMQKVITTYDMNNYLSGKYKTPKGFVSICADVKQYKTTADMFYGLRLDYSGTYFDPEAESFAVIRYMAKNAQDAVVPRSPANGGTFEDPYPFGGAGFTTGTNGRWGSPEWVMKEFTVLKDGAQLYEVYQDGLEVLRGQYTNAAGQFEPQDEKITRGAFVELMQQTYGFKGRTSGFTDIAGSNAEKAILAAAAEGIVNGDGQGEFHPNDPLTREQLLVMVSRAEQFNKAAETTLNFKDSASLSSWAKDGAAEFYSAHALWKGAENLQPKAEVTKTEAEALMNQCAEEHQAQEAA